MNFAIRIVEAWFTLTTIAKVVKRIAGGLLLVLLAAGCAAFSYQFGGAHAGAAADEIPIVHWLLLLLAAWIGLAGLKRILGALVVLALAFGAREEGM